MRRWPHFARPGTGRGSHAVGRAGAATRPLPAPAWAPGLPAPACAGPGLRRPRSAAAGGGWTMAS